MKPYRWKDANPYCPECLEYHVPHLPHDYYCWGDLSPQIPINKPIHSKRRLRKKKHQGEYQELGFNFEIKLKEGFNYPDHWEKADEFVFDPFFTYLHDYGLCLTGFPNGLISACSPYSNRFKLHEGHIKFIKDYFKSNPAITAYRFGPLVDMWYLSDEEWDKIKSVEWINK